MALNVVKVKSNAVLQRHLTPDELLASWLTGQPTPHNPASHSAPSTRLGVQAVLFDLDGVLVDTAEFHYQAWKRLADELGIPFNRSANDAFRGVPRSDCLAKLLGEHARGITHTELHLFAERKNSYYLDLVKRLTPKDLAPGARSLAMHLRAAGVRMALVSASKNARLVLNLLGITDWFQTLVDGHSPIKPKPHPEGFLLAARQLHVQPARCIVLEDAEAGIRAGQAAGAKCIGIGTAAYNADLHVPSLAAVTLELIDQTHLGTRIGTRPATSTTHTRKRRTTAA